MKNLALADWERLEVVSFEKDKKIKAQVAEKRGEAPYHKKQKRNKIKRIRGDKSYIIHTVSQLPSGKVGCQYAKD